MAAVTGEPISIIRVSCANGTARPVMGVSLATGDPNKRRGRVAAAPHRLISILDAIDGERIMLDASSEPSPIRITPVGHESLLALVIPCEW
jgi:hypothetical protein